MKFNLFKFAKIHWAKLLSVFFFAILSISYIQTFAVFTPGQTLDPNCSPGSGGCYVSGGSGSASWGSLTGSILDQTDLQSALSAKQATLTISTGLTNTSNTLTNNLSTGVSGGQSVIGGTASGNNLTLSSTSNATKGKIIFGTSAYDEVNNMLGLGTASPGFTIDAIGNGIQISRAGLNPLFNMIRTGGTGSVGTINASFSMSGPNSIGTVKQFSQINGLDISPTNSSEIGGIGFKTLQAGVLTEAMTISGASVGIGVASPSYTLDVAGNAHVSGALTLNTLAITPIGSGSISFGSAGTPNVTRSFLFGNSAGQNATNANYSNFFGDQSGYSATNASYSNFLGNLAGQGGTNASYSNFLGYFSGLSASNASYSNLFGYQVGYNWDNAHNLGSNNIIIGTNISLPNGTANAINLGNVLYGTGTYSNTGGVPSITPSGAGRIGIGVVSPSYTLDVAGTANTSTGYCISGDCISTWNDISGGSSQWDDVSGGINYGSGFVGIGNGSPENALDISTGNGNQLRFGDSIGGFSLTNNDVSDEIFRVGSSGEFAFSGIRDYGNGYSRNNTFTGNESGDFYFSGSINDGNGSSFSNQTAYISSYGDFTLTGKQNFGNGWNSNDTFNIGSNGDLYSYGVVNNGSNDPQQFQKFYSGNNGDFSFGAINNFGNGVSNNDIFTGSQEGNFSFYGIQDNGSSDVGQYTTLSLYNDGGFSFQGNQNYGNGRNSGTTLEVNNEGNLTLYGFMGNNNGDGNQNNTLTINSNGNTTFYRSYKNGENSNSASNTSTLSLSGVIDELADPTNLNIDINYGNDGYQNNGHTYSYRIYAYHNTSEGRIYSDSYAQSENNDDGNDDNTFNIYVYWDSANNADGYRILRAIDGTDVYDYGYDTTNTDFTDDNCSDPQNNACFDNDPEDIAVKTKIGSAANTLLTVAGNTRIAGMGLAVQGMGDSVQAPANIQATQTCSEGCTYVADSHPHNYRIYSFKNTSDGRVYSPSYLTLATNFIDDGSNDNYDITITWDAAQGANGYRILKYDPDIQGYNYDTGYDTTSTSFVDADNIWPGIGNDNIITPAGNSDAYLNFGQTIGLTGYGFRDNAGSLEYRNSGGSWSSFSSIGGGESQWDLITGGINYAGDAVVINHQSETIDAKFIVTGDGAALGSGFVKIGGRPSSNIDYGLYADANQVGAAGVYLSYYDDNDGIRYGIKSIDANAVNTFAGKVGIGTDQPESIFHIKDLNTAPELIIEGPGDNQGRLIFRDSNGDSLTIVGSSAGDIGMISAGSFEVQTNGSLILTPGNGIIGILGSDRYLNFNSSAGSSGYGFRDNGGTMEYKDSGGAWSAFSDIGGGGGGSGTVNSGTQYQLAYYASSGTVVSGLAAITGNRALVSDSNGLIVAATTTDTEMGYLNGVTSAIQTQIDSKLPTAGTSYATTTGTGFSLTSSTLTSGTLVNLSAGTESGASTNQTTLKVTATGTHLIAGVTTYALDVANNHHGSNLGTAIGARFSAGSGGNDYAIIVPVSGGRIGFGTSAPTQRLDVVGASGDTTVVRIATTSGNACTFSTSTGSFSCASDSRLKHDIASIGATDALSKLSALNPVLYRYNWQTETDPLIAGFIVQEFEQTFPELVSVDSVTGYKSLSYAPLIPYTVKAIQEMDIKIKGLSSLDLADATSLGNLIKTFISDTSNSITDLYAKIIHSDRVETKELCFDGSQDLCFTKEELLYLKQLKSGSNQPQNNQGSNNSTPEPDPTPEVTPEPDPQPETEETITPTPDEPISSETPAEDSGAIPTEGQ